MKAIAATPSEYFGKSDTEKENFLKRWAFRYAYDSQIRMTQKQVPGAEPVYMVYDNRNRLALTQDGNQRTNKYWSFTKYDQLNRPILTGIKDTSAILTQAQMQDAVNLHYTKAWAKWGETYVENETGNVHGYSNKSYPLVTSGNTLDMHNYLTVTYYDNYKFDSLWYGSYAYSNDALSQTLNGITYNQPGTASDNTIGLVTGTKVKVLDGGPTGGYTWLKTVSYYDDKYRVIQTLSDNYKGGTNRTSNLYDFTGKVLKTKTTHTEYDVAWKDLNGVYVEGNKLVGGNGAQWNMGAVSSQVLAAGQDGWVEFVVSETTTAKFLGLADTNPDNGYNSMDYAFQLNYSTCGIKESGSDKTAFTGLQPGDILRIQRTGTTIYYKHNGATVYTSDTPSLTSLMVDCSFHIRGNTITGARTSFGNTSNTILRRFEYDHAGRLTKTYHQADAQAEVLLTQNEYNELGQLIDKKLHSVNGSAPKQSLDYRYNIRGWLTKMNESQLSAQDVGEAKDFFGFELGYNNSIGSGNEAFFNGNISAMTWSNNLGLDDVKEKAYNYSYDGMNRITSATYKTRAMEGEPAALTWTVPAGNAFSESGYSYDLNGNIRSLTRKGANGTNMDVLTYDYAEGTASHSNKLMKVTDAGDNQKGFKEFNTTGNDYVYDANGNMVWDQNKGGKELLKNGEFNNGSADWTISGASNRLSFTNGTLNIAAGSESVTILQDWIIKPSFPHVVTITIEKTAGDIWVLVGGGAAQGVSTTGTITVNVTSGPGVFTDFRIVPQANFVGKIHSVSVKGLAVVTYNCLNLPEKVSVSYHDHLQYVYDATGRKLCQVFYDSARFKKKTDYSGEYLYENDTLKFINHEEGRIIPETDSAYTYQYNMKDHLGNVRLTFTTKREVETFTATLEDNHSTQESADFPNYNIVPKSSVTSYNHTQEAGATRSVVLNGAPNKQVGLAKSIKVLPGDTINLEVYAKYFKPGSSNPAGTEIAEAMTTAFGLSSSSQGSELSAFQSLSGMFSAGWVITDSDLDSTIAPKAFLNFILFDEDFIPYDMGFDQIDSDAQATESNPNPAHDLLSRQARPTKPGYIYVYISNEDDEIVEVYFDDLKIEHVKSPVIRADDYYPFGLTFNSYQRENSVQNKRLFNGGAELQTDLNLGWYSTLFRIYDPAIGRFLQIDPLTDLFSGITPYNFAENNPILYGDPSGLSPNIWQRIKAFFGVGRLSGTRAAGNREYVKPVPRSKGKPVPYDFGLPKLPPTPVPQPAARPKQHVVQEEHEEEEPAVVYIPPAPILRPKQPIPGVKRKKDPVITKDPDPDPDPDPTPLPFDIKPGGTTFDGYQFEPDKSDLYRTPTNDKLINDLIIMLKSSSSVHLEIKGNVNADPSWWYKSHQKEVSLGRAQAIYNALRAAGIPASQLHASPGEVRKKEGNMSATFKLTKQ